MGHFRNNFLCYLKMASLVNLSIKELRMLTIVGNVGDYEKICK